MIGEEHRWAQRHRDGVRSGKRNESLDLLGEAAVGEEETRHQNRPFAPPKVVERTQVPY